MNATRIVPLRRVHVIPESACNGNCVQGRMCDCVPAVEIAETPLGWRFADWTASIILVGLVGALFIGLL